MSAIKAPVFGRRTQSRAGPKAKQHGYLGVCKPTQGQIQQHVLLSADSQEPPAQASSEFGVGCVGPPVTGSILSKTVAVLPTPRTLRN